MFRWFFRISDRLRRAAAHDAPHIAAGRCGEDLAHRFLQAQRYTIVARNYRPRSGSGEIDLIARDGDTLVFVEVKTRATEEFGTPDRAVDAQKLRAVERAAREYARRANVEWKLTRFDVVNVILEQPPKISLIKDAFRLTPTI